MSCQDTRWGSFTPLQRCSRCILQLQPTRLKMVNCHIQNTRWGGSYPSAEMQSVYSTTPADTAEDGLLSYPEHSLGWVLPLCRDAVGVFYNSSRHGWRWSIVISRTLVGVGLTPLQRCSRFILQLQPTGLSNIMYNIVIVRKKSYSNIQIYWHTSNIIKPHKIIQFYKI